MWIVVFLLLGASVSVGEAPPPTGSKSRLVSDAQVETWLRNWQKRLHLDDWHIETRIVRSTDLKPDTLGNLKWNSLSHTAMIKVLNPDDYDLPGPEIAEDIEYTIVHELVHLQLSVLPRDLNKKDVEEGVVNKIADALMGMDKGQNFRARSIPYTRTPGKASEPEAAGRAARP